MSILEFIGAFQIGRWLYHIYKHRRIFMNKDEFWKAVKNLRHAILNDYWTTANKELDNVIEASTGGEIMNQEQDLQKDVARIIKRIKEAKENEALKEKANKLIEELKKEL